MKQSKDIIGKRKEKIQKLKESGIELFPNDYRVSHTVEDIKGLMDGKTGDVSAKACRVFS